MNPTSIAARRMVATTALAAACAHAAVPTYRVTPVSDGRHAITCSALDKRGDAVGTANVDIQASFGYDAVIVENGRPHSVGWSSGGPAAEARGINARGVVVGDVIVDQVSGTTAAAFWRADGTEVRLRTHGGGPSIARGVNDVGAIVGSAPAAGGALHATLWSAGQVLDLAPGPFDSGAWAVNAHGQAAGGVFGPAWYAARFEGGTVVALGTLGGTRALGVAINDAGHVVGYSTLAGDGSSHAFWHADGVMHDLGAPPGLDSTANAINANDVIVGSATDHEGSDPPHALVWIDGVMYHLDALLDPVSGQGWSFGSANAINDAGQICADGRKGAAVLTPM